jgi:hypothetical protein
MSLPSALSNGVSSYLSALMSADLTNVGLTGPNLLLPGQQGFLNIGNARLYQFRYIQTSSTQTLPIACPTSSSGTAQSWLFVIFASACQNSPLNNFYQILSQNNAVGATGSSTPGATVAIAGPAGTQTIAGQLTVTSTGTAGTSTTPPFYNIVTTVTAGGNAYFNILVLALPSSPF